MRSKTVLLIALALFAPLAACKRGPDPKIAAAAKSEGDAFLARNKAQPGVVTLPDGVQYKILVSGPATGASPKPADEVKVNYEGKLLNGTIFDSSFERGTPASFPLRGLIPAWVEVMQKMKPGDEWMIWVPPAQAYGDEDKGPIPANSVLQFRIQLIDFLPAAPASANG